MQQIPPDSSMYVPKKPKTLVEADVQALWNGNDGEWIILGEGIEMYISPYYDTSSFVDGKRYVLQLNELD